MAGRLGANSYINTVPFPSLAKVDDGKSAVRTVDQPLALGIPTQTGLELLLLPPFGLGLSQPGCGGRRQICPRHSVVAKLPDEYLIASRSGDEGTIRGHG